MCFFSVFAIICCKKFAHHTGDQLIQVMFSDVVVSNILLIFSFRSEIYEISFLGSLK